MRLNLRNLLRSAVESVGPRGGPIADALESALDGPPLWDDAECGIAALDGDTDGLDSFRDAGIPRVRLLSSRSPDTARACLEQDGAEMKLAEARRCRPIPHAVGPGETCECVYLPIM